MAATRRRTAQSRARRTDLAVAAAGSTPAPHPWHPPGGLDIEVERVGVAWDAVKAPTYLGDGALVRLGDTSGAVIRDPWSQVLYWLVPVGTAESWVPLPQIAVLGSTCWLAVPPGHRTRSLGPYWALPPTGERQLTDPGALHEALTQAIHSAFGAETAR